MQTKVTSCEMTAMVKKEKLSVLSRLCLKSINCPGIRDMIVKGEKTILTFCDMLTDFLD